jgi:hypothetical protein
LFPFKKALSKQKPQKEGVFAVFLAVFILFFSQKTFTFRLSEEFLNGIKTSARADCLDKT